MISFIYPIYNRADLFRATLASFVLQDHRRSVPFEIIVVDDGSTDSLRDVLKEYTIGTPPAWSLPIRYVRIDLTRLDRKLASYDNGANNCAGAINIGLKEARGEWAVLTSPEVRHAKQSNLRRINNWCVGMREPQATALVANVYDDTWIGTFSDGWIAGGPHQRPLHFFTMYPRMSLITIGGMEEDFLEGKSWEDVELVDRWLRNKGRYFFTGPAVAFQHQPHARGGIGDDDAVNEAIYRRCCQNGYPDANHGRVWGDPRVIVERWP